MSGVQSVEFHPSDFLVDVDIEPIFPAEAATELGAEPLLSDGTLPGDEFPWFGRALAAMALVAMCLSPFWPWGCAQ